MNVYNYPTNVELKAIDPKLQALATMTDSIFKHFPVVNADSTFLMWEQQDDFRGMQQVRGINGQPGNVKKTGSKSYLMEPGYYGEKLPVSEKELTERRKFGQWAGPVDITDLVAQANRQLLHREIVLIRAVLWNLASTGTFSVIKDDGSVVHTDTFPIQKTTCSTLWSTKATATPLGDLRAVKLTGPQQGTDFGTAATMYMSETTFNTMLAVTTSTDIGALTSRMNTPVFSLDDVNKVLIAAALPKIELVNDGYLNDAGTWTPFLADGLVVIFGARPMGASLGEYRKCRNASNDNMAPGSYIKVVDSNDGTNPVPRTITIERGHNGGPVIYFPGSIHVLKVF